MPYVEVSRYTRCGAPEEAYRLIRDMERYPEFMPDVDSVEVLERKGNTTVTHWKTSVDGIHLEWQEFDVFDDENFYITYCQTAGDLRKFEGAWRVRPEEGGALVTLTVDFELGIPMIAGMVNPLLKKKIQENCANMLLAIEKELSKAVDSGNCDHV